MMRRVIPGTFPCPSCVPSTLSCRVLHAALAERHSGPLLPAGAQVWNAEVMDVLFLN